MTKNSKFKVGDYVKSRGGPKLRGTYPVPTRVRKLYKGRVECVLSDHKYRLEYFDSLLLPKLDHGLYEIYERYVVRISNEEDLIEDIEERDYWTVSSKIIIFTLAG